MGDNDITIPVPDTHEVQNVIERPNEAIPHIVQHEGRITHIEEQQAAQFARLLQEIQDTKQQILIDLEHSRTEQARNLEERLKVLEEKAVQAESTVVEAPSDVIADLEQAPTQAVEIVPEVEKITQKAEPKGIRQRRKAKHKS